MKLVDVISSDLARLEKNVTLKSFFKQYFFPRGGVFRYTVRLRLYMHCKTNRISYAFLLLTYLFLRHYEYKYGIHVNTNAEIGEGLHIVHGDGVHLTVNKIGKNVTVYQGITCGAHRNGYPIIEDNVTIHPNSVVVGPIVLHKGCVIGANSYVDKDVEENAVMVGAPAHRIR